VDAVTAVHCCRICRAPCVALCGAGGCSCAPATQAVGRESGASFARGSWGLYTNTVDQAPVRIFRRWLTKLARLGSTR